MLFVFMRRAWHMRAQRYISPGMKNLSRTHTRQAQTPRTYRTALPPCTLPHPFTPCALRAHARTTYCCTRSHLFLHYTRTRTATPHHRTTLFARLYTPYTRTRTRTPHKISASSIVDTFFAARAIRKMSGIKRRKRRGGGGHMDVVGAATFARRKRHQADNNNSIWHHRRQATAARVSKINWLVASFENRKIIIKRRKWRRSSGSDGQDGYAG